MFFHRGRIEAAGFALVQAVSAAVWFEAPTSRHLFRLSKRKPPRGHIAICEDAIC